MKFSTSIVGLALMGLISTGCKDTASKPATTDLATADKKEMTAATHPQTAVFKIDGMTCAMGCAKTIEEKLAETKGVQNATVDFETKRATVNFDADQLKSEELKKTIESCADGKTYKASEVKG